MTEHVPTYPDLEGKVAVVTGCSPLTARRWR
jgi:hypothetical protein